MPYVSPFVCLVTELNNHRQHIHNMVEATAVPVVGKGQLCGFKGKAKNKVPAVRQVYTVRRPIDYAG